MTAQAWLLAGCLVAGATAVAWPASATRRRRPVPGTGSATGSWSRVTPAVVAARVSAWCAGRPHRFVAVSGGAAVTAGWVAAGPVAAAVAGSYAALGARAAMRRAAHRRRAAAHARTLDGLCALAADLRAGLPQPALPQPALPQPALPQPALPQPALPQPALPQPALPPSGLPPASSSDGSTVGAGGPVDARLGELTMAVWRLAERTGAPAADLVERIEADARAGDRARASAAAQAAGARATALLLAGLPIGGIALGYGIGVDPLRVLLHSPLGAGCAAGAVLLQAAGLAWTDRLAAGPPR